MAPNMLPKRYQKSIKKMIEFLIDFWRSPEATREFGPAASALVWGGSPPLKLLAKAKSDMNMFTCTWSLVHKLITDKLIS